MLLFLITRWAKSPVSLLFFNMSFSLYELIHNSSKVKSALHTCSVINQLHCSKRRLVLMYRAVYTQQCHSRRAISISDLIICHLLRVSIHHTLNYPLPLSLFWFISVSVTIAVCHSLLRCQISTDKQTFLPMDDCCGSELSRCVEKTLIRTVNLYWRWR